MFGWHIAPRVVIMRGVGAALNEGLNVLRPNSENRAASGALAAEGPRQADRRQFARFNHAADRSGGNAAEGVGGLGQGPDQRRCVS